MKNLSYLAEKPIAVLGAGAAGRTHAADCALAGKKVRLFEFPDFFPQLGSIADDGIITLEGPQVNYHGFVRAGRGRVDLVTSNMAAAVAGAGLIVIAMPAVGFKKLFDLLVPCLEDGQVVHFMTGNFGSILLRKKMKDSNCGRNIMVGEWSSQPYGTRMKSVCGVLLPSVGLFYRAITLKAAALPHRDTADFIASGQYLPSLDSVKKPVPGDTVLDICFSNVNPVLHCPGAILGASVMENYGLIFGDEKSKFSIYSHSFCPTTSEVQYAFYLEQKSVATAVGFSMEHYEKEEFFSRTNVLGKEFLGKDAKIDYAERYELLEGTGPFTIFNRYITEDIPVGCCVQSAFGRKFGAATPVIDAMICLASIMTKVNFLETGWTLNDLGLADLDRPQLMSYLKG